MDGYPNRQKGFYFAFLRAVWDGHVASELGPNALVLLLRVAESENRKFWKFPARFYRDDLCDMVGMRKFAFMAARKRLLNSGWLHYEKGTKSDPSTYWVVIPSGDQTESCNLKSGDQTEARLKPDLNQTETRLKPDTLKKTVRKEDIKKGNTKRRQAFARPTFEMVQAYCVSRERGVDPEKWWNHYSANGWKVGRNAMKDWKAAVRTWESNGIGSNGMGGKKQSFLDNFTIQGEET